MTAHCLFGGSRFGQKEKQISVFSTPTDCFFFFQVVEYGSDDLHEDTAAYPPKLSQAIWGTGYFSLPKLVKSISA